MKISEKQLQILISIWIQISHEIFCIEPNIDVLKDGATVLEEIIGEIINQQSINLKEIE